MGEDRGRLGPLACFGVGVFLAFAVFAFVLLLPLLPL
jgi:hypothetical protein